LPEDPRTLGGDVRRKRFGTYVGTNSGHDAPAKSGARGGMLRMSPALKADATSPHGEYWRLFARLLLPYRLPLTGAAAAVVVDAALPFFRPWPRQILTFPAV